ncbi:MULTISPECIES: hypothetical protein [Vibrio]|uniref:hypothetical protein n=1 Tax=Vibrio TaxID=662 RepID=UPI00084B6E80|nr:MULTISPECIES: hypothetical protein [Vibrio]GIB47212.1 hypothetical protein VCSRO187_1815 [Vibrio cholerae]EGR9007560.1 hypothetical protein [Vibrio vulnificus]MCU8491715.1 hypothetical protein [Vibrio vulnificus]MCU8507275.1 hypothetical protein [Vibrio vulnificus]MCX4136192.1 hypothetical protein [Vibrio parahaemolyticus]
MNTSVSQSPSAILYNDLCKSANSKRRENAQNIKLTCDHMVQDGVEITLSGVAKRCLDSFGNPAISTVTNTGSKLGEYVRLRKQEQNINKGTIIARTVVSAKMSDPVLAQQVKILEETVKGLRNENNALRVIFKKLNTDIDNDISSILLSEPKKQNTSEKLLPSTSHTPHLKSAVASLLRHLADRGYGMYRGRFGINKKTVLTTAELDALKEVIDISEAEFNATYGNDK